MVYSRSKKLISMLIIFVIVFSYMGQTLEAIATTDGLFAITNGFLNSREMKFNSYFEEGNTEKVENINETANLILEIAPNDIGKGFLKEGMITANEDSNFKFFKITNIAIDELEEKAESIEVDSKPEGNIAIEEKENFEGDIIGENTTIENETSNEVTSRSSEPRIQENSTYAEQEFINEEKIIQNKTETYEELTAKDFEMEIINDNQIKLQNIIYNTKIEIEIEYNKKEIFHIADLYKQVNLQLKGTYINIDLEKIEIEENQEITVGWEYHKDIELAGEYMRSISI